MVYSDSFIVFIKIIRSLEETNESIQENKKELSPNLATQK